MPGAFARCTFIAVSRFNVRAMRRPPSRIQALALIGVADTNRRRRTCTDGDGEQTPGFPSENYNSADIGRRQWTAPRRGSAPLAFAAATNSVMRRGVLGRTALPRVQGPMMILRPVGKINC